MSGRLSAIIADDAKLASMSEYRVAATLPWPLHTPRLNAIMDGLCPQDSESVERALPLAEPAGPEDVLQLGCSQTQWFSALHVDKAPILQTVAAQTLGPQHGTVLFGASLSLEIYFCQASGGPRVAYMQTAANCW